MNSKLMYGEGKEQDWFSAGGACQAKDVTRIDNNDIKNNALEPKVSIPSPYARFELVQKAFANFVALGAEECDTRDLMLISHTLDLMELFYENQDDLQYEQWEKREALDELKNSENAGHRLFGLALDQYGRQENYGFSSADTVLTIIKYGPDVVGCTSPTSIMLATPRYDKFQSIKIEGARTLFDRTPRMLFARDVDFIEYVYRMAAQFIGNEPMDFFIQYLEKMRDKIRQKHPQLYKLIANFPDKTLANGLDTLYEKNGAITLYGQPFYQRKKTSALQQLVDNSDFILQGAKNGQKPMVLTNNCEYSGLSYTTKTEKWSLKTHAIDYSQTVNPTKRKDLPVPGTSVHYEWLCENDLLSDLIVKLPYAVDEEHFFYGSNNGLTGCGFLIPLKDKFFEYFNIDYLCDSNGDKKNYEIQVTKDKNDEVEKVVVLLRVPITGGKPQTLKKTYYPTETAAEALREASGLCTKFKNEAVGRIMECPIAISIFPFARLTENNIYRTMLTLGSADDLKGFEVSLIPRKTNMIAGADYDWNASYQRSEQTTFYSLEDTFDFLQLKISDGAQCTHTATCIPVWPKVVQGTKEINFAFDFGTTNSFIAVQEGQNFIDFKLGRSVATTLKQSTTGDIASIMMQLLIRQEFLPQQIGDKYKFPLRTVVLRPLKLNVDNVTPSALLQVNIPFIYGKEDYNPGKNEPKPNLKWSQRNNAVSQMKYANAFIEEMLFLSRAFAIEYGADLHKTNITWTYPLSMRAAQAMHDDVWKTLYAKYFNKNASDEEQEAHVTMVTESIAPLLYYSEEGKMQSADMEISVDIGGGTCDVVLKNGNDDIKINSFRFAADVIFNAGRAKENKMIAKWHKKLIESLKSNLNADYIKLLTSVCTGQQPSSEANSLLFALETLPELDRVVEADKSYNAKLKTDGDNKVLFLYFYGAIIYYLAKLTKQQGYSKPGTIYFSGTGSKLLNIIGGKNVLQTLTTQMLTAFGGFDYGEDEVRILIESKEPKQLTAKGALAVSSPDDNKPTTNMIVKRFSKKENLKKSTIYSSLTKKNDLTYADLKDKNVLDEVIKYVEDYNSLFINLANQMDFEAECACAPDSILALKKLMQKDLMIGLQSDINDFPTPKEESDILCESLFFYPIKSTIQKLIIEE